MPNRTQQLRLDVLTRLGQRLPVLGRADDAALEVVEALGDLDLAATVIAVHADTAVVSAIHVPSRLRSRLSPALASRLVGMRFPLEGVDALRQPVLLRRPYRGMPAAVDTLRSVIVDSELSRELPLSGDEVPVASVPVIARDRVMAVLVAWGPACADDIVPVLETAAAMLASGWGTEASHAVQRFASVATGKPTTRVRRTVSGLLGQRSLVAAVQPIVRLHDDGIIGYEGLVRFPPRPPIVNPDELFASATALNMQGAVDLACIRAALREAPRIGDATLFVNVLIGTLLDPDGIDALNVAVHDAGTDPRSVVLEFSEREPVTDLGRLQAIAAEVRARGFRIAVDDAGAGHASMRIVAELRPEFIKVDRSLITGVDADRARRALVVALLSFSGHIGARLIAEGIETDAERDMLSSLGVMFGQGWLLGRPVLTAPVEGHAGTEIVDDTWFARHRVISTYIGDSDSTVQPQTADLGGGKAAPGGARRALARALAEAARGLQSEHDPHRIVGVMAEMMTRVVPVSEMAIFAADYETHRMVPMFAAGEDRDELLADSFSLDVGLTGWAFAQGKPFNVSDTAAHPLARQVPGTPVVEESLLLIPLVAGEHKLGIINCWRLGVNQFSQHELEAASLFAHIAAAAWRNAQLYAELVNAAMTDPLTRLYNSRWLRDSGEREIARAGRDRRPLSLLLIDLDHFKQVNDGGGHAAGDLVLQRVATRLRATVRGADAVVRLGGEEFVALLDDCDSTGAGVVADAIRLAVRDIGLPESCGLQRLTASIGIATYPDDARTLEQLLALADRAMYSAKQAGRDRIARAVPAAGSTIVSLRQLRRASGGSSRGAAAAGS